MSFIINPLEIVDIDSCMSPNIGLRRVSSTVIDFGNEMLTLIEHMRRVMSEIPYATGLSAIQVNVPIRLFIFNPSRKPDHEIVFINPVLTKVFGPFKKRMEGCVSLPNFKGQVTRRSKVSISFQRIDMSYDLQSFDGYYAAIIQHEMDHLNGILYWDHLKFPQELIKL